MPEYKLEMVFENSLGKTSTITIPYVLPELDNVAAGALMDAIIAADIFSPGGVTLTGKADCQRKTTTSEDLYDPE